MKITYEVGTSQLRLTTQGPSDVLLLGRIAERVNEKVYSTNENGQYYMELSHLKILSLLSGQ
jgi:hypothetical protein